MSARQRSSAAGGRGTGGRTRPGKAGGPSGGRGREGGAQGREGAQDGEGGEPAAAAGAGVIWERPEPAARPAPGPLSRAAIVRAAVALADAQGLEAVSLRKVGAALGAGPMRLYGYLSTKEEMLELMVDAVYGEMAASGPIEGGWRQSLRTVARRMRAAALRHPWFPELLGGRPHQGPHALAHLEASLAALAGAPGFEDIDAVMGALFAVNAYVLGALRIEASERRAERDSGLDKAAWQLAQGPYIFRVLATGRFPTLARLVGEASHPPADDTFERGLEVVLDGIARRPPPPPPSLRSGGEEK